MRQISTALLFLLVTVSAFAQADSQKTGRKTSCDSLLQQPITFFEDGTVRDRSQVYAQLEPLIGCEVDKADAELLFKGPLYSSFMSKLSKGRDVYNLTFQDIQTVVTAFHENEKYQTIKETHVLTEKLASLEASWADWEEDRKLFEELKASTAVINQVQNYLRENPQPGLTYLELLKKLKQ